MHNQKHVFSQLLDFLDRNDFNYLAREYGGDKYVKQFTCYNQLAALMFGKPDYNIVNELDGFIEPTVV